jgi:hypothetical protein
MKVVALFNNGKQYSYDSRQKNSLRKVFQIFLGDETATSMKFLFKTKVTAKKYFNSLAEMMHEIENDIPYGMHAFGCYPPTERIKIGRKYIAGVEKHVRKVRQEIRPGSESGDSGAVNPGN